MPCYGRPLRASASARAYDAARRMRVLTLARREGRLEIAVADPYPVEALQSIQATPGLDVPPVLATNTVWTGRSGMHIPASIRSGTCLEPRPRTSRRAATTTQRARSKRWSGTTRSQNGRPIPTVWGEKGALRVMEREEVRLDLEALGMDPADLEIFRDAAQRRDRMLLVTEPVGSGKSTTLYSLLTELNDPELNIVTVEDPVERRIAGITQANIQGRGDETDQTRLTFTGVMMNCYGRAPT